VGAGSASYAGAADRRSRYNIYEIDGAHVDVVTYAHDSATGVFWRTPTADGLNAAGRPERDCRRVDAIQDGSRPSAVSTPPPVFNG